MKGLKAIIPVLLGVLKDFRVIATLVAFLLVIMIAGGIANYRKKPPRPKKEKPAPAPKAAPKEQTEEEAEAEPEE